MWYETASGGRTALPDLCIRNARIADGTGRPAFGGDVGISGDRITAVGRVEAGAARGIDARGLVLAPGFIDVHTHYDPQICWDRLATPSLEHGVTTVVMGSCSLLQIAGEIGHSLPEVMLDLALADGLRTELCIRGVIHADVESVSEILSHPLVHVGAFQRRRAHRAALRRRRHLLPDQALRARVQEDEPGARGPDRLSRAPL